MRGSETLSGFDFLCRKSSGVVTEGPVVIAAGAEIAKSSDAGSEGSIESSLLRYLCCVRLLSPEPWNGIRKLLHRFTVTPTTFLKLVI